MQIRVCAYLGNPAILKPENPSSPMFKIQPGLKWLQKHYCAHDTQCTIVAYTLHRPSYILRIYIAPQMHAYRPVGRILF